MTKDEVNLKTKMWEMINADYIKAKAEKEEREKQEAEEAAKEGNEHSSFAQRGKKKNYKPLCSAFVMVFYLAYLALAGLMNFLACGSARNVPISVTETIYLLSIAQTTALIIICTIH